MITVESRDHTVHYTVYDRHSSLVVYTHVYSVARAFESLVARGYTVLDILDLARSSERRSRRLGGGPAARTKKG